MKFFTFSGKGYSYNHCSSKFSVCKKVDGSGKRLLCFVDKGVNRKASVAKTKKPLTQLCPFFVKAYVAGLYSPMNVWIWLETYPVTWWHDTVNRTQHEILKTVVQYSFSFGDNNNVFDNTTKTIAGRVRI